MQITSSGLTISRVGLPAWFTRVVWCFVCWLLIAFCGLARADLPPPKVLGLTAKGDSLVGHMAYLVDPQGKLTIQDIRTEKLNRQFVVPDDVPYFKGGTAATWFAVRLRQVEFDGDWLIALPTATLQDLQIYGPIDSYGRDHSEPVVSGSLRPYGLRPLGNELFVARAKLSLPGEYTVYIRSTSQLARNYELKMWDVASFYVNDQSRRLFDGLCYGVMLGLLVYNFVLFLIFRDRSYGLYVLQGALALLSIATFNGHLARYILPDLPILADRLNIVLPALWITTAALFAHNFLALSRFAPRVGKVVYLGAGLSMVTVVLGAIGAQTLGQSLNEYISTISTIFVLVATIVAWRSGFLPARLYLAGQFSLFIAVYSSVFVNWGWLRPSVFTDASLQIGVTLEFMIFALALSSRIRLLQDIQIDLTRKAVALTQASETDPLTNVANRAGLASAARKLLVKTDKRTVILMDLDKFKPINDLHGHSAGDAMLVEIGKRLKGVVRGGDVVARVGGDEFVILISEPHERATLEAISQRLLDAIKQPLLFGNTSLAVGGSLGLAIYPDNGTSLDDLLHAADVAMYHIKKNGRDGFAFFDDLNDKEAQEAVQGVARASDKGGDSVLFEN